MPTTQTVWISFSFQVDISTMLEEAMHYVKFLQLQIKVRLFAAHMTTSDYSLCSCQNCSASCIFFSGEKKNSSCWFSCSSSALMKCGCTHRLLTTGWTSGSIWTSLSIDKKTLLTVSSYRRKQGSYLQVTTQFG